MRHLFVSSLLGIFLAVLGGCVKKDIPTTGAIHGVVKDSESAQPLVGCSVMLMPTGATTVTGTDGSFHFQDILPDTYSVEVSCHGYYTNKKSIIVGVSDASMSVDILLTRFDPNNRLAELGAFDSRTGLPLFGNAGYNYRYCNETNCKNDGEHFFCHAEQLGGEHGLLRSGIRHQRTGDGL